MNRDTVGRCHRVRRVPRTRGDEPWFCRDLRRDYEVFPARVGMNRQCEGRYFDESSVPRTRGDEPVNVEAAGDFDECSPHAWG